MNVSPDGDFGPGTVRAYESWTQSNGKTPVVLRDSKTAKQVLEWIDKYWPSSHKCAKSCPVYYGEFLAMIYYESRDKSTAVNGGYTYFNAVGGPFASKARGKLVGTTAVGLAQFTNATAPRNVAYDGELSIQRALNLLFQDAAGFNCNFTPSKNNRILQRGLNRWEAWRTFNSSIKSKGAKINDLIQKTHKGEIGAVTDAELNAELGI